MATVVTTPARTLKPAIRSPLEMWHLLSLDAPTVTALWTIFLARASSVPFRWTAPAAIGLAVWMFYAADRMSDAAQGSPLEERHRFHYRFRRIFGAVLLCAVPLLALLVAALPPALRNGWLWLALPLTCYVIAVHIRRGAAVPKEPLVATFFACATMMPIAVAGVLSHSAVALIALSFGLLCWLNLAAIARWEFTAAGGTDRFTAWISGRMVLVPSALAFIFLSVAVWLWLAPPGISGFTLRDSEACALTFLAAGSGAATLGALDVVRGRFGAVTLRALADVALLTPAAIWPLLSHLRPR